MFSVVITTHNRLAFLKKAIASALGQTVACEIIVVDDLATDGTEQYCRGLGEKIVYLRNMSNLGQSASVNRGIQAARGEWIKHLDDDDYMYANCIEEYESAIKCFPAAVLCNCLSTIVSENGDTVGRKKSFGPGKMFSLSGDEKIRAVAMDLVNIGPTSCMAVRRDIVLKAGGWWKCTMYNDSYIVVKSCEFGDLVLINRPLVYCREWRGAIRRTFSIAKLFGYNFDIKKIIYSLEDVKRRPWVLPPLKVVEDYLRINWFCVGLKRMDIRGAIEVVGPAMLSFRGWSMVFYRMVLRGKAGKYLKKLL